MRLLQNISNSYGLVLSNKDTIANVIGLLLVVSGELVSDNRGGFGMVLNLEAKSTRIVTFDYNSMMAGSYLFRTEEGVNVAVNPILLGNVFNSLGQWINRKLNKLHKFVLNIAKYFGFMLKPIEVKAPGIIDRDSVREPLYTGFIGIDGLLPLGRGQRELIIGDRQTGKTSLALDIVFNQSNYDLVFLKYSI